MIKIDIIINGKKYDLVDEVKIGPMRLFKKIQKDPEDLDSIILLVRKLIKNKLTMKEIDEFGPSDILKMIETISQETEVNVKEIKKKRQK